MLYFLLLKMMLLKFYRILMYVYTDCYISARRPDIVYINKNARTVLVIDIPVPTSEYNLLAVYRSHHQERLSNGTIKSYFIRYEQISKNSGNPNIHLMPHLEYVLKGIKCLSTTSGHSHLPISLKILTH